MSIWAKLAAAEVSMGATIGALFFGGAADPNRNQPDNDVPFTAGMIALSAKMAKSDGHIRVHY